MHSGLGRQSHQALAEQLEAQFGGRALADVGLSQVSNWRVGGPVDVLYQPSDEVGVSKALVWLKRRGIPVSIIGMTTNLLFADAGVRGVVMQMSPGCSVIDVQGDTVRAGAGAWVPQVAFQAMRHGLSGLEHTCGIPGTVGGLVGMNGGSLRRSISDCLVTVTTVAADGSRRVFDRADCGFDYRTSRFQKSSDVIVECLLRLDHEIRPGTVRQRMLEILRSRSRFPRKEPNCGSVFVSHPEMYSRIGSPGRLIEELGQKGRRVGGAMVSPQHANFIVNTGGATADDVLTLISDLRRQVYEKWGYLLQVEARYVDEFGVQTPAEGPPFVTAAHR